MRHGACCALCLRTTQTQSHRCAEEFGTAQAAKKKAEEATAAANKKEEDAPANKKEGDAAANKKEEAVRCLLCIVVGMTT
jgi:membrane protein involved in colicin uptake